MNIEEFRKQGHKLVDWMADYLGSIEERPVKAQVNPGDIFQQLPTSPPNSGEQFEAIFRDFESIILPGMTHWQHPSFFAYFQGNNSAPSILAEMLTSTLGAQCMVWLTSPAAAELEEMTMCWLAEMLGLPDGFEGVIQDTASTATLCALLTAREKATNYAINEKGFPHNNFTVYSSAQVHSSIDKAVKVAGVGVENLRKIAVDENYALIPEKLEEAIQEDISNGMRPLCIVAAIGTTGSTAVDPLRPIAEIANRHGIWLHVDAAYAGTALVLPEFRWMNDGVELADSFTVNPHKWMFTNFDCNAYFVKDKDALIKTFAINPEYLKTKEDDAVNNYRDWGIQLGRRFRALKLWVVIRSFGVDGIKNKVKLHIELGQWFADQVRAASDFELMAPVPINTVCFRYHPANLDDQSQLNNINQEIMDRLNDSGKLFLTHTKLNGNFVMRLVPGQTTVEKRHVEQAWELITTFARGENND